MILGCKFIRGVTQVPDSDHRSKILTTPLILAFYFLTDPWSKTVGQSLPPGARHRTDVRDSELRETKNCYVLLLFLKALTVFRFERSLLVLKVR